MPKPKTKPKPIKHAVKKSAKFWKKKIPAQQSKKLQVQFPVSSGQQHRKAEETALESQSIARGTEPLPGSSTQMKTTIQSDTVSSQPVRNIGHIAMELLWGNKSLPNFPPKIHAPSVTKTVNQNTRRKLAPQQLARSTGIEVSSTKPSSSQATVGHEQHFTTTSVSGGVGMSLLQKMGWQPGEGLGKYKEGLREPLSVTIKLDKRGLSTKGDSKRCLQTLGRRRSVPLSKRPKDKVEKVSDKNPVTVLTELCVRRKFGDPQFDVCQVGGPDHMKTFLISVRVNGVVYKPNFASQNKKLAKAEAATVCLRGFGLGSKLPVGNAKGKQLHFQSNHFTVKP